MSRIITRVVGPLVVLLCIAFAAPLAATGAARPGQDLAPQSVPTPTLLTVWGGSGSNLFYQPMGVAVDDHGDVYVTDPNWDRVSKFSATGKLLKKWGTHGSGDGQFDYPYGIAFFEGNAADPAPYLYVVDAVNYRVEKFTPEGLFVDAFGSKGSGPGQFASPGAIAVGPSGNVYVTDFTNRCIEVFDAKGTSLGRFSSVVRNNRAEHLMDPRGIAVAPSGTVYVADDPQPYSHGSGVVDLFTAGGTFLSEWTSFGPGGDAIFPHGIALDQGGDVYVVSDDFVGAPRVLEFTAGGAALTQWSLAVAGDREHARSLFVAVAPRGDIYVTDWADVTVKRYGTAAPISDTVAPVTKVHGADGKWHNQPVALTFTATDNAGGSGIDYTQARLDDAILPFMWGPWTKGEQFLVPADAKDHRGDGERRVQYRSADQAGNVEKDKQVKVLIDTRAPKVTVLPASVRRGKTATVKFKVVEALSPKIRIQAEVLDGDGRVVREATSQWLPRQGLNGWSFVAALPKGAYTTRIVASDLAGNQGLPSRSRLVVE
jgi:hypothetical protein